MRQGVAIPPKNLKQKDEDLLDIHRRKLKQRKQPEVMLKRNARSKDQYADKRAGGMTWSEMRGRQNLLELDDGKFQIDLVCFCVIVQLCNNVF